MGEKRRLLRNGSLRRRPVDNSVEKTKFHHEIKVLPKLRPQESQ
jgi:hypothetical protein